MHVCAAAMILFAGPAAAAGPYTKMQVLLPGETAAPGTVSGKTGTAQAQTAGVPFNIIVRACDDQWNLVATVTDQIQILSSDASATLPPNTQLAAGTATLSITFNAGGNFTINSHDLTDGTIPDATSSLVRSLVLQGFTFSKITQKNQYAGVAMSTTISAVDPSGNVVSGYNGTVSIKEITSYGDGRTSPTSVTLTGGTWSGSVAMYRADETSINRGNVNLYAWLPSAPAKNGTSDPFTVHPGNFARVQIVTPGEAPLPGSVSGVTGSPATQSAGKAFTVNVYATDNYWNPLPSGDNVRITSSDGAANTPLTGTLTNGTRAFSVSLGTVGTQTLTVSDVTNSGITPMTSAGIPVIPSAVDHFVVAAIASPQTAGVPVAVTIRATDVSGNTIPNYNGDANLVANTGPGSISPTLVTFVNGVWTGPMTFRGAGGAVSFTCSDFSSPPHSGTSNNFVVQPGPYVKMQVLLPGETALGGSTNGKSGTPTDEVAGAAFTMTVRAVDAYWNMVSGVSDSVRLGSTDLFATMPAETLLSNGQVLVPTRLYRSGPQTIWASDPQNLAITPDTSAAVNVIGGAFARVLVLAPGESPAPGTVTGRTGTPTDENINYAFNVTVLATDQWWNPVTGVTDMVRLTSGDAFAKLPGDSALVNGSLDMPVRLGTGGFQQITVQDVSQPSKTGSTTQVRAITSGFHLQATVSPSTAQAGAPWTLTVKVTNDAGAVITEINSFVTVTVKNSTNNAAGRGTLLVTRFQLLQGQRSITETYTYAEPIVLTAADDAGNAPAISNVITITPGAPNAINLTSSPSWVGGDKHAKLSAQLVDAFNNGIPGQPMVYQLLSGTGTLSSIDSLTDTTGTALGDFLSPRQPEMDHIRASSSGVIADLMLQVAFVDPNAAGGTMTNYPNPFHPPSEGTTLAYVLSDNASVHLRIFTLSGDEVLSQEFSSGSAGGMAGLNTWVWDGKNGKGTVVASGGYIALLEAHGVGETLHVIRRKIAVVR